MTNFTSKNFIISLPETLPSLKHISTRRMNGNCLEIFKTGEKRFFPCPASKCSVSHYPLPLSLLSFSLSLQHKSLHITSDDGDGDRLWNIGHQLHIGTADCCRRYNCMLMSWKREIIYSLSMCVGLPSNLLPNFLAKILYAHLISMLVVHASTISFILIWSL